MPHAYNSAHEDWHDFAKEYCQTDGKLWRIPLLTTISVTAFLNVYSFALLLAALRIVKVWIDDELEGWRKWRWKLDGLFIIYLSFFMMLFIDEMLLLDLVLEVDPFRERGDEHCYEYRAIASYLDFRKFFMWTLCYTLINFLATLFVLYMLERMSRAIWSNKKPEEEQSKKTSQMDREVAAGWFDSMLLDMDFQFVNYKHNIPRESFKQSVHSSDISTSLESSKQLISFRNNSVVGTF